MQALTEGFEIICTVDQGFLGHAWGPRHIHRFAPTSYLLSTPPRRDAFRHSGGDRRLWTSPTVTLYFEVELSKDKRPGTEQNTSPVLTEIPPRKPSLFIIKEVTDFGGTGTGERKGEEGREKPSRHEGAQDKAQSLWHAQNSKMKGSFESLATSSNLKGAAPPTSRKVLHEWWMERRVVQYSLYVGFDHWEIKYILASTWQLSGLSLCLTQSPPMPFVQRTAPFWRGKKEENLLFFG